MVQGISSFICSSRVHAQQLAWRNGFRIYAFYSRVFTTVSQAATRGAREYCESAQESCEFGSAAEKTPAAPLVDRSFTATHYVADGRRFEFATVFVKSMNKGRSPLSIWQHACSLLGSGSPPTFGVAFVSKPTESAKEAIQAFAQQLARKDEPSSSDSSGKSDVKWGLPDANLVAASGVSLDSTPGLSSLSEIRESLRTQEKDIPPLIGCIMDDMGDFGSPEPDSNKSSYDSATLGSSIVASSAAASSARASGFIRPMIDDNDDGEESTLSDWEGVCTEYIEEVAKGNINISAQDYDEEEEDTSAESTALTYGEISKEGLASFLNALTKPPQSSCGANGVSEDVYSSRSQEIKGRMPVRKPDEVTIRHSKLVADKDCRLPPGDTAVNGGVANERIIRGDCWSGADGGLASPIEIWTGSPKPGGRQSGLEINNEEYKLVLCIGHMPGATAIAFHSSTTGLPRLPDLAKAVTDLCFQTSSKDFLQFFPIVADCRAGAFLAPLYTSEKSHWGKAAQKTLCPVFFGSQVSTTGVVGLAISAKGRGGVSTDAFAELVRMSVAMPRIPGFVFLDEPTSARLFLPKNLTAQHLFFQTGTNSSGQSSAILERLSKQLLKVEAFSSVSKDASVSNTATYSDQKTIEVGVSRTVIEEQEMSDRLPLALFDAVLFPGWSLPFYIFEPCYRAMVRQCVEDEKPFGVSTMYNASWTADADHSEEVIGTAANLKVHSFQKDGRSYIIAQGIRRFRVAHRRVWAEPGAFGLTVGEVEYFDDEECKTKEEKEELGRLSNRALALCLEVIPEGVAVPSLVKSAHDPVLASFAIGHVMDVPTRVKRRWLKLVDTKSRLLEQIAFLETKASSI
ncbi:hypothetical protein R1sor_010224 [Riccia sorocarpa]|uniref:Lon N-terminal domain-containing protein n=1 Tax=Riccia sorocarpa TaxID=122646 RepID=A0ABD3HXH2_9MARC